MILKVSKFGCDRSVIHVSLFEGPFTFSAIYRFVLVALSYLLLHRIGQRFATIAVCLISMCQ